MTIRIENPRETLYNFMRSLGYRPLGLSERQELNCVRPMGADYPRLHIYAREEKGNFVLNLHLDQKKPSYQGATAHSGDYDSPLISVEAKRILEFSK